jgi:hypothetical protein
VPTPDLNILQSRSPSALTPPPRSPLNMRPCLRGKRAAAMKRKLLAGNFFIIIYLCT